MKEYLDALNTVYTQGTTKGDRTKTGTLSYFGLQLRFSLLDGFPIVTTKKIHFKSIAHELLWFIRGDTNIKYLNDNGVTIWDEWADKDGNLGRVYGKQWREWRTPEGTLVDQLSNVISDIKRNPNSRRLVVTAWNPGELHLMKLPPCHILYQFYVNGNKLSLQMYQRSADMFLGLPFNITSYALLLKMVAHVTNFIANDLIISIGDAHIYSNHVDQVVEQLQRKPYKLPELSINAHRASLDEIAYDDLLLYGYQHHPHIKGDVAV
jgi:thymidylate synthase